MYYLLVTDDLRTYVHYIFTLFICFCVCYFGCMLGFLFNYSLYVYLLMCVCFICSSAFLFVYYLFIYLSAYVSNYRFSAPSTGLIAHVFDIFFGKLI
jgi:hypothetical protein